MYNSSYSTMSAGIKQGRDSPIFEEVKSLYTSAKNLCRSNYFQTAIMGFAEKVGVQRLMLATINYLLYFVISLFTGFWFGSTWVEILEGLVAECLCVLVIACLMSGNLDDNENSMITGVQVHQVLTQVLQYFLVLLGHLSIYSVLLLQMLRQTLQEIENCIENDENLGVIFISERGLCHLLTLYDNKLQYQIEELLVANSTGFILAMNYACYMIDKANANTESKIWSLEIPGDVLRLINLLWMLSKLCAANINFNKTSLNHEAARKVLTVSNSIQIATRKVPFAGSTHSAMDNEYYRVIVTLAFTTFRYIGGAFLMYMSGRWALLMWILVEIILSDIVFGRTCSTECNSLALDNPSPVQYYGLNRFFLGMLNYLLFNQGYLKHYQAPTMAILLLPGTFSFYLTIMVFNALHIISSPFETLVSNVGVYYTSAIFGTIPIMIPIMIYVIQRLFTRTNGALTQQQMLLP